MAARLQEDMLELSIDSSYSEDISKDKFDLEFYSFKKQRKLIESKFICLLANNDSCQLFTQETQLKHQEIGTETSFNGHEAFQKANESFVFVNQNIKKILQEWPHQTEAHRHMIFDVIVLDLDMPICNGFEACQMIQELYTCKKLFSSSSVNGIIQSFRPLIIAFSSKNLDSPAVKKDMDEAGFDFAL